MDNCIGSYLSLCRPLDLGPSWELFGQDTNSYCGPNCVDDAFRTLTLCHSEKELLEARLVLRDDGGHVALHPSLAIPDVAVIALTDPVSGSNFEIVTERGCITATTSPLFAVLEDRYTRERLNSERNLILCAHMKDISLLRSLGIPAAPVCGVTEFGEQEFAKLESLFHCASGLEIVGPLQLTLMNWSPTARSLLVPTQIRKVVEYLGILEKHFGYVFEIVDSWAPSQAAWLAMEYALNRKQPGWFRETLSESLLVDREPLRTVAPLKRNDLAEAYALLNVTLLENLKTHSDRQRYLEARAAYQEILTEQIVRPLFARARTISDPVERSMLIQYAELYDLYSKKMRALQEYSVGADPHAPGRDPRIGELNSIVNQLASQRKELQKWNTSKMSARKLQSINLSRFAASDSITNN